MVFSSHVFLFYFLPLVLGLYYAIPHSKRHWRQPFLTLVSYCFYGWANPWFVFLMFFSTIVDYICGLMIAAQWNPLKTLDAPGEWGNVASAKQRKLAVFLSVVVNLSLLGFFKYFVFVQENLNWVLDMMGKDGFDLYIVILPVGISFYTFQSMSYSIDLYRGDAKPAKNLLDFSCYVALFPQLVAGPIVRYQDIAHQLSERTHSVDKFARGVLFFIFGFSKKILLANPMGEVADAAFNAGDLLWYDAWVGVTGYAFQIYFDFSGYSDMAIGLGLMFGFNFPKNFDSPYHSDSITDFWRRWHLSLSTWLRDYLYFPLGGNRLGNRRTYINLALVMLLGGMWHGSKWNFIIWGAIHGVALGIERAMGRDSIYRKLPRVLRIAVTFVLILFTWVFFRATDLGSAMNYIYSMFGLRGDSPGAPLVGGLIFDLDHILMFAISAWVIWGCRQSWDHAKSISAVKMSFALIIFVWAMFVMFTQSFNPFLYFQF